ncbi:RIB43A-like with coiled-coils protein 1 [Odontesthes bonariensis]|uniref:RIB43A-like with coiled-coils protein 1 n=1 Tax=Odontesthes bonariensis TaxID=219752 RepID=UPI003F58DD03
MYKVDLPIDQSTEKAVERRRSAETARKARVFNTRLRVMGLDLDALHHQVEVKKHQQDMEKQRDKAFDMLRKCQDEVLLKQDTDEKEKQEALYTDLTKYWATQQQVEDSHEADLKCGLKGALKITTPVAELGPASMQIFQGEGIGEKEMRREQIKKTERELLAQMDCNKKKHMGEKHRETLVNKELLHQDLRGVQQAALEAECKKSVRIALDNYNQALAAERAENLKEQRRREDRENHAELWHTMTSDVMTESAEAAEIDVGGGRPPQILPDRWKGMRPEQLSTIQREQERQRLEKQRHLDAEKIQSAAWDLHLLKVSREVEEEERRTAELRREHRIQMDQYNMQLAREQQAHQENLNKKLYTNKPTKDYFHQFNTSSR